MLAFPNHPIENQPLLHTEVNTGMLNTCESDDIFITDIRGRWLTTKEFGKDITQFVISLYSNPTRKPIPIRRGKVYDYEQRFNVIKGHVDNCGDM